MGNKKATLYIEFRHNQARLDLIGNTHVALKECVKPYGIRNHTYQRDKDYCEEQIKKEIHGFARGSPFVFSFFLTGNLFSQKQVLLI